MDQGAYLYAITDRVCILKLVGQIIHTLGPGVDRFLIELVKSRQVDDILIDMTETEYIDSTNLGVLARITQRFTPLPSARHTIISTNSLVNEILMNLNFDRIFNIITEPAQFTGSMEPLPVYADQHQSAGHVLLKAHRYLMSMSAQNHKKFIDVVEYLKDDLQKQTAEKRATSIPSRQPPAPMPGW